MDFTKNNAPKTILVHISKKVSFALRINKLSDTEQKSQYQQFLFVTVDVKIGREQDVLPLMAIAGYNST